MPYFLVQLMNFSRWLSSNRLMAPTGATSGGGAGDGEIPDHDLIKASQKGDTRSFEVLVTRHRGKVYAMIHNL